MDDRTLLQLLGGISHDLSNVLLAVRVHASLAAPAAADADQDARADSLRAATERLQRLIESMHVLAGEGVGNLELERWWAQTSGLMSKVAPRGFEVLAEIAPALPRVRVDQGLLTRRTLETLHSVAERVSGNAPNDPVLRRLRVVVAPTGDARGVEVSVVPASEFGPAASVAVLPVAAPEAPAGRPCRAAVTIASERSSAIVRFMLATSLAPGSVVAAEPGPGVADVWVVEPGYGRLQAAQAWRNAKPEALLILVGDPGDDDRPRWAELNAVSIAKSDDLERIRGALGTRPIGVAELGAGPVGMSAAGERLEGWGVGSGGASK